MDLGLNSGLVPFKVQKVKLGFHYFMKGELGLGSQMVRASRPKFWLVQI